MEEWVDRYDKELDEYEAKVMQLNIKQEQLEARHNVYQMVYDRRQQEIEEWLVIKEQRRQEEEYRDRCIDAAEKIQVNLTYV